LEDIDYRVNMTGEDAFEAVFNTRKPMRARVTVEPIEDEHDRANEIVSTYMERFYMEVKRSLYDDPRDHND